MRKVFMSLTALLFIMMISLGYAEAANTTITSGPMYKSTLSQIKTAHYDYKKGSLVLTHVERIHLNQPIKVQKGSKKVQVTQVTAAVAQYKTVRDSIFFKDWKDDEFYDTTDNVALQEADVAGVKQLKAYQAKYPSDVTMELGMISLLLILVFLIPGIFSFIWARSQYSTLEYKIKYKLFYGTNEN